ncbi:MAG TPA: hypothetical protein PKJ28_08955 [Bacteroidales bacterium]|nr:hypothetical protein [Bacteroidales bacterium]HPS74696.1 hypothetical protein [Bacteroidales bacterium]
MRKVYTFIAAVLLTAGVCAQSPEKMSYQAVIRNGSDQLVTNTGIGMQISILQGSASGTSVFVETHTTTTNANGLVSIEIGNGTIVSGDFATIDWANGPYFIKTETDPTGGISYSITGTSQLLSVPYTLYAKTAGSITGGITETDPVYTNSEAANITDTDIINLSNLTGVNTGDQNLSTLATKTALGDSIALVRSEIPDVSGFISTETDPVFGASAAHGITATDITNWNNKQNTIIAGSGIAITGNVISTTLPVHYIGESFQGGTIFWLDETGQHGLIAAPSDMLVRWYNGTYRYTGSTGDGLYAGIMNTAMIVAAQLPDNPTLDFAAKYCANYSSTQNGVVYGDWYFPSRYELNLLYLQKYLVPDLQYAYYWCSTEGNAGAANMQSFWDGAQTGGNKDTPFYVRPIRAF